MPPEHIWPMYRHWSGDGTRPSLDHAFTMSTAKPVLKSIGALTLADAVAVDSAVGQSVGCGCAMPSHVWRFVQKAMTAFPTIWEMSGLLWHGADPALTAPTLAKRKEHYL